MSRLSHRGRRDLIISPPLRGGDKGEGDIFMLLCEPMAHVDSRGNGNPFILREFGYPPEFTLVKTGAGMTDPF